ncbi:MAG TPA: DUF2490 domain-containing protein [Povalibacter sp.]|uniref:DUF2490 domain-containing protein n=1 Tax=Povalibacter sp. TaxID=1962978 RepID=UPI002B938218|nr:DUF2490 domain-containing protein [Povalibacter sp.]HMN43343.1 DUF2490 domain-containing protein [Povalibacter sp.]
MNKYNKNRCLLIGGWFALAAAIMSLPARADDKSDEYRVTVFPSYALTEDKKWIGIGYLGYVTNDDEQYDITYLGLGTIWRFRERAELWGVVLNVRTDNEESTDINEYRPLVGLKNYFTRSGRLTFYNLARMEYRIQDRDVGEDTEFFRFRDRLGTEFALTQKANEAGAWYGLADAEAFYRFDRDMSDLARLRIGLGYVFGELVRAELIYHMQFTRAAGESFDWTDNIWRLNFKVARQHGLLSRLAHGDDFE